MQKKFIPYNPKLKLLAKNLRNNSTLSEVLLWNYLKGKQMMGYDFHRQKPLLNYIVDFFCPKLNLVIEIDGSTHDDKLDKDIIRQKEIEKHKVCFLRFTDLDVKKNMEGVLITIKEWIEENS